MRKFYATLPHKIDAAVDEYMEKTKPVSNYDWVSTEELIGETELGGEMRININFEKDKGR